ncbi:MAG: SusD/RagB family nutrient-binding outer membrane lipoprotein, partial [Bacteroidales bacterium]
MNKRIYGAIALSLGLSFSSCSDWLDINENPDAKPYVTPEQSLPVLVFYASQINYDHAEYGVYLSQALTTGGKSQTGSTAYKSGWEFLTMNRHPHWRRHFYDIGVNGNSLIEAAGKFKSPNFTLIARTIQLMSMQLTTDAFGDMPRSEAYTGKTPKYDTQESIYQWMLQEADALIADYDNPDIIDNPSNKSITKKRDRIYGGDLKKWKQFTIALKARILLRKLPNWDNNPNACDQIINTVNLALENWTEPDYNYD